jgi:hypothetical protein
LVVLWCVLAPLITYLLKLSDAVGVWSSGRDMAKFNWLESIWYSMNPAGEPWFGSYVIGFESLIVNAAIVILGLGAIDFAQKRGKAVSTV